MKTPQAVIANAIKKKRLIQDFVSEKTCIPSKHLDLCLKGKRAFKTDEFLSLCLFLDLKMCDFQDYVSVYCKFH